MLNSIKKRMEAQGYNCEILRCLAGAYFDGADHGHYYQALYIDPESWDERAQALKIAERIASRRKDCIIQRGAFHQLSFSIVSRADREAADTANAEAKVFYNAHDMYRHFNAPHTADGLKIIDPDGVWEEIAIAAGKTAVEKWKAERLCE